MAMPDVPGSDNCGGRPFAAAAGRFRRGADQVVSAAEYGLGLAFAGLVFTVGYQVLARNVFGVPAIWTPDLAQLLFSWLIFVGSGFAFRRNGHYTVDLFPPDWARLDALLRALSVVAALVVGIVLIRNGLVMVDLRGRAPVETLGISRAWMYWPLPILGMLIIAFTLEKGLYRLAGLPR